eukprot:4798050-Pleurochrysis_carterae.AAC.1
MKRVRRLRIASIPVATDFPSCDTKYLLRLFRLRPSHMCQALRGAAIWSNDMRDARWGRRRPVITGSGRLQSRTAHTASARQIRRYGRTLCAFPVGEEERLVGALPLLPRSRTLPPFSLPATLPHAHPLARTYSPSGVPPCEGWAVERNSRTVRSFWCSILLMAMRCSTQAHPRGLAAP